ncbi:MAG: TetR/AcrR family transcriptional regulator [Acidimicrobiales bacterium]
MATAGRGAAPPTHRRDADRNRQAILLAAHRLYAEHPGAPLSEVARVAGVGQATLYRHFPDRSTLMGTLAREALDDLTTPLSDGSTPPLSRAERLELVAHGLADSRPLLETVRGALATAPATRDEQGRTAVSRLRVAVMGGPPAPFEASPPSFEETDDAEIVLAMLCGALETAAADPARRAQIARRAAQIAERALDAIVPTRPTGPHRDDDPH